MVEVNADYERRAGITLVRATVKNTRTTTQRVRLRNALDGPTWPPRRGGVTAPEWTDDTWEGIVEPKQCRGVGFASPAVPPGSECESGTGSESAFESAAESESGVESTTESGPLVEVVAVERAPAERRANTREVLAELDDWSPPREVFSRPR